MENICCKCHASIFHKQIQSQLAAFHTQVIPPCELLFMLVSVSAIVMAARERYLGVTRFVLIRTDKLHLKLMRMIIAAVWCGSICIVAPYVYVMEAAITRRTNSTTCVEVWSHSSTSDYQTPSVTFLSNSNSIFTLIVKPKLFIGARKCSKEVVHI